MSADEENEIFLSPSESDMNILQGSRNSSGSKMKSRDILVERRFKEPEREISSLKHRNSDSSKASGGDPKLPRKTEKSNKGIALKKKALSSPSQRWSIYPRQRRL